MCKVEDSQAKTAAGLHMVAAFEASKGVLVILAGFGLLSLLHHDAQRTTEELVSHCHLNPAKNIPHIFIQAAANVTDTRILMLALLAGVYASMRLTEAYGLWRSQKWAEWFAIVSGGVYIPFEVIGLSEGFSWLKASMLTVNGAIVARIAWALKERKTFERL